VQYQKKHTPNPSQEGNVPEQFSTNIFSLNSKLVKTINLNPKLYQQKIEIDSLNNGVYFVKFSVNGEMIGAKKLVIAK
jgi:hypothetical protein